jgi:hypothetical protein
MTTNKPRSRSSLILDSFGRPFPEVGPTPERAYWTSQPPRPTSRPVAPALPIGSVPRTTVAVIHVRGKRVAWSLTPAWSPLASAKSARYRDAAAAGLAGVQRRGVVDLVRRLLRVEGVRGVLVHGTGGDRMVYVTTPEDGGSLRAAWSATQAWSPFEDARSSAGRAARAAGLAGVGVGVPGLIDALSAPEVSGEHTWIDGTNAAR